MQVDIVDKGEGTAVISLIGRMDASTTGTFDETIHECMGLPRKYLVLDMAGLEYISSAGLRSILVLVKGAKAAQTTLAFCALQPMVAEIFEVSGFTAMLHIYATQEAALAAKG